MAKKQFVYTRLYHICDLILEEFIKQEKHSLFEEEIRKVADATPGEFWACEAHLSTDGYIEGVGGLQSAITPLGEFFIINGGYEKKLKDEWKRDRYADNQYVFNRLVVLITAFIALATIWQACGQDIKSALNNQCLLKQTKQPKESKAKSPF
jgi:hypothetical protein